MACEEDDTLIGEASIKAMTSMKIVQLNLHYAKAASDSSRSGVDS